MSRYIERLEAWRIDGVEPRPDWAESWGHERGWLVRRPTGVCFYTDERFKQKFELADPIPDDDYKFYSGFEILDAVNK